MSKVCSQKGCEETAMVSYTWPEEAERVYGCDEHADAAHGIALSMGFVLGDVRKEAVEKPQSAPLDLIKRHGALADALKAIRDQPDPQHPTGTWARDMAREALKADKGTP